MNGIAIAATGRVMTEPEQKYTASGEQMLSFSLIVDENTTATEGRPVPEPTWLRCTVWDELAETLAAALHKGSPVYVEGKLRHGKWQTTAGESRCGLNVSCWKVEPLGLIGKRSLKREGVDIGASEPGEGSLC